MSDMNDMSDTSDISNTSNTYIVNVSCNGITGKKHIYNKFDYEIIDELYNSHNENGYPIVYKFMYELALRIPKNKILVTFSPDPAISSATITGLAEKYMCGQIDGSQYTSKLRIIYLTSTPNLLTNYKDVTFENLRNSIISNAICKKLPSYTEHKLPLTADQFFLLGINDNILDDDQRENLDNSDITYFTLNQMRKKGITNIINYINDKIMSDPVIVIFDMASTSYDTSPCVTRFLKEENKINISDLNGFNTTELFAIFSGINKENLVGVDITSFDFRINSKERAYRISCETARIPLNLLLGIKEKKINIFNEHSKFLIYRPVNQLSEFDVGWYILRGVSLDMREEVIKHIDNDTIISLTIDSNDLNDQNNQNGNNNNNQQEEIILVTTTTILDQQGKCIYSKDTKITDCTLYPTEKTSMMFELLNTYENSLHE